MAQTTLREELENIFERFNEFTYLGMRNGFKEDIARVPKLQFAKQISEAFQPKEDTNRKKQEIEKWLYDRLVKVAASVHTTSARRSKVKPSEEVELVPGWNNYVKFKEAYALLVRRLLRDLNKLAHKQKWLDAKQLAQTINEVNLRQMWMAKEKASASYKAETLKRVLAKMTTNQIR